MKRLAALLLTSISLAAISFGTASADVNNFVITDFNADETLTRNDPQGELHVIENISLVFSDNNHGIYRQIPSSYKGHSVKLHVNKITSDTNAPTSYEVSSSSSYISLKIGDPNRTVAGAQEYTIDYTVQNVIGFYPDHDELYWDVNGNGWDQNFEKVSVTLHQPDDAQEYIAPICFTGSYGSTDKNCAITNDSNTVTIATTAPLQPQQTLTYVTSYKKGYFTPTTWADTMKDNGPSLAEFLVPILLLGGGAFLYWFKKGRDAKGTGIIVPQYGPPEGLLPLEAGTINDFRLDGPDITATIIDLAIRGYVRVVEAKIARSLFPDGLHYTIELTDKSQSDLSKYETDILLALFAESGESKTADISSMSHKLATFETTLSKQVEADLTAKGYFRSNPLKIGSKITIFAVLIFFIAQFAGGAAKGSVYEHSITLLIVGVIVGVIIAGIFALAMPARTAKGVEVEEYLKGLKMFLNVTEKERLKKMQSPDAPYAANAHEPVKTVDLFEKLLPYAIVLGVEKEWAGQFANIYTSPPSWYVGNYAAFNAVNFTSQLNNGIGGALNNAFSSSSGSGVGGGGSGGGGGGGGGGGW